MKRCYWVIILCSFSLSLSAQETSRILTKYMSATIYLRSNRDLNDSIKKVFPKLTKKKSDFVSINLTDDIRFQGLEEFELQIESEDLLPDSLLKIPPQEFNDIYRFNPYKIQILGKLLNFPDSKLFLTFSQPVGNILTAKITTYIPNIRMGRVMYLLFIFDEYDVVKNVLCSSAIIH